MYVITTNINIFDIEHVSDNADIQIITSIYLHNDTIYISISI